MPVVMCNQYCVPCHDYMEVLSDARYITFLDHSLKHSNFTLLHSCTLTSKKFRLEATTHSLSGRGEVGPVVHQAAFCSSPSFTSFPLCRRRGISAGGAAGSDEGGKWHTARPSDTRRNGCKQDRTFEVATKVTLFT